MGLATNLNLLTTEVGIMTTIEAKELMKENEQS